MNKYMTSTTALKPSFGMPVHGAASPILACTGDLAERVRPVAAIVMDAAVAPTQRAFAGTPAWRPPSC